MHFAAADYDTLVFDCDGVILDSNRIKTAAFRTELNSLTGYNSSHSGEKIL